MLFSLLYQAESPTQFVTALLQRDPRCKQQRTSALILQLCDGASETERKQYFLRPAQEFHYLNQSTCYVLNGVSNAEEYKVRAGSGPLCWKCGNMNCKSQD